MLHQLFPSARPDGRNVHHPRAFRDREKAFAHYEVFKLVEASYGGWKASFVCGSYTRRTEAVISFPSYSVY